MSWDDFLISKKIDSRNFQQAEPDLWESWKRLFEQMHPKSFTAQKLYLINPVRRKYPLREAEELEPQVEKKSVVKPKIAAAIKPKVVRAKPVIKRPKTN